MDEETSKVAKIRQIEGLEEFTYGIPMYLASEDGSLPADVLDHPMFYVLTGNGPMLVKNGPVFSSISKVDDFIGLGEIPESLVYRFAPIPEDIVKEVAAFFHWAAPNEAMVLPYYNTETKEWRMLIPEQQVSAGSIDYDMKDEIPEGFVRLGSWHSHGSGSAYHSSVDTHDEEKDDGVHITFGGFTHIGKRGKVSCSVSLMCDGSRWMMDSAKAFDLEDALVEVAEVAASVKGTGSFKSFEPKSKKEHLCWSEKDFDSFDFPEDWKAKVKKVEVKVTSTYGTSYGWTGGSTSGSGSTNSRIPLTPNSLQLCPECGGCKSCASSLSLFSLFQVYRGKNTTLIEEQHDYTTPEGRLKAFAEAIANIDKSSTYTTKLHKELDEEQVAVVAKSIENLASGMVEAGISQVGFPTFRDGHPDIICADPQSIMFGKAICGSLFCLHHRPRPNGKGWVNRTEAGYTNWILVEGYDDYVATNGAEHYSKLRLDYKTCSECVHYDWNSGCEKQGSPYFDLTDSPTGCNNVEEEIGVFPTCIHFYDIDEDEVNDDLEFLGKEVGHGTCGYCKFYDFDTSGLEDMCIITGKKSPDHDHSCSNYETDPLYKLGTTTGADLMTTEAGPGFMLGSGDVVTGTDRCYTCEQRVIVGDKSSCLVYNDRLLTEQKNCGFYVRASLIGAEESEE